MPHAIGPGSLVASRFRLDDLLEDNSGALFWRATDLVLARNVAIHVLTADDVRAPAALTAARTAVTVSDPRILRVLDAVEEGPLVHVIHEWGSGVSLDRRLAEDVEEPRRAAWLVREVAEAITVAHRHGVAHGRLLPENVLLTDAGSVKLIGFVVDAVLHGRPRRSPEHPAPPSEHERDVLNLGALLYACLTGRWPGDPASSVPTAPLDHGRYCRPRQVRPGVPRPLDALCDRLVNPGGRGRDRVETAAQVVAALSDYLGEVVGMPLTGEFPGPPEPARIDPPRPGAVLPDPVASGTHAALPPAWAPDPDPGAVVVPAPGSSWLRLAAVVGVLGLLLLAVLLGFHLGRSDPDDRPSEPAASAEPDRSEPMTVQARDFDPEQDGGTPEENPDLVGLAVDGDPATAWETVRYNDGPALAPYKSGVGLLLDLGKATTVRRVEVTLDGSPYDLELLAAAEGADPPTSLEGLVTVDTVAGASGTVALSGRQTVVARHLVVWLTALPPVDGGFRGAVAEVVVTS